MAHNHHLEFLRNTDPANGLFIARLRLQDLEHELEDRRRLNDGIGEHVVLEDLADLYRAAGLVRTKHAAALSRIGMMNGRQLSLTPDTYRFPDTQEDEIQAGVRDVLDRITSLTSGTSTRNPHIGRRQKTVRNNGDSTRRRERSNQIPCIICDNWFQSQHLATTSCNHKFCRPCLLYLFEQSLIDETLFPPKCCKPIPPDLVAEFLTPELIQKHYEKQVELQTVDRTYCSDLQCNKFIPPNMIILGIGVCKACEKRTCLTCKAAAHGSRPCIKDEETAKVLKHGEEKGWKRCPTCHTLVSLVRGCNHVTCRCGTNFCYGCGKPMLYCSCSLRSRLFVDRHTRERPRPLTRTLFDLFVVSVGFYLIWYWILLFLAVAVALHTVWITGRRVLRGY